MEHNHQTGSTLVGQELNAERILRLRKVIDEHLRSQGVYTKIRSAVADFTSKDLEGKEDVPAEGGRKGWALSEEEHEQLMNQIVQKVNDEGILEDIRNSIAASGADWLAAKPLQNESAAPTALSTSRRLYLQVSLRGGKAFFPANSSALQAETDQQEEGPLRFELHIWALNQRFVSQRVRCTEEPAFRDIFIVPLEKRGFSDGVPDPGKLPEIKDLAKVRAPLHFVLLKINEETGERELVGTSSLEWRRCLVKSSVTTTLEITAPGQTGKNGLCAGLLTVRVELLPSLIPDQGIVASDLTKVIEDEQFLESQAQKNFYQYAKKWWQQFAEIRSGHIRSTIILLFAGLVLRVQFSSLWSSFPLALKTIFQHIVPVLRPRPPLFDTPRHAARFVSLIPFVRVEAVGGGREEIWYRFHTFLSLRQGDCEGHALLLCSLFLGFGLDAYICVGTLEASHGESPTEVDHVWVMTRSADRASVSFWESLTGQRYAQEETKVRRNAKDSKESRPGHTYRRVGCVFNHHSFYANKQNDDRAATSSFNLEDESCWKAMSSTVIRNVPHQPSIPFIAPRPAAYEEVQALEATIKHEIAAFRRSIVHCSTVWDDGLSYILAPALQAYELERTAGIVVPNGDFQDAIKLAIPSGYSFKGFPTMFSHTTVGRILTALQQNHIATNVLATTGDKVSFGLALRLVPYPEELRVLWLMLGVKYLNPASKDV